MPTYEFRCRVCDQTFTKDRPMAQSSDPAACPQGHEDTVRLLTTAGAVSSLGSGQAGGCCGGGCCGG
ncbi:MAG: zinc ribbon domain-containing protein [Actinobacteria bacterium]|nr:zinc ribbon domain-containing protein [Actinomycetota bacterium]MCB8997270.1 zinc ribbon domain-containing protein [Actinomycetota bacterium]MCB9423580.1 zinc ribbon domain-containing protein [Actinomycetota bacterium]